MKNRKIFPFAIFFLLLLGISSCAPEGRSYTEYGFFSGIIHGFCFPVALIGKVIGMDVGLYAEHNSGFFYWIGFLFGIGGLGGGASR